MKHPWFKYAARGIPVEIQLSSGPLDPWECHQGQLLGLQPWLSSKTPTFWVAARPSALVVVQTNGNVQWWRGSND